MCAASNQDSQNAWAVLREIAGEVAGCRLCKLAETRTNTVPGEGAAVAEIMFVGEGPGADEDVSGRPFLGRAGKFLDDLIASIPMRREDVYIANVVKCRPPGNRNPEQEEVGACSPYLEQQIDVVDPLVIVTLGSFALNWFFPERRITRSHGEFLISGNRIVLPLFHPASGLRNPSHAKRLRQDILKVPDAMVEAIRMRLKAGAAEVADDAEKQFVEVSSRQEPEEQLRGDQPSASRSIEKLESPADDGISGEEPQQTLF